MKRYPTSSLNPNACTTDEQAYASFYRCYAPQLWGVILLAELPRAQSEVILVRTCTSAWGQRAQHPTTKPYYLSWLIGLAYAEGLHLERVHSKL